MNAEEEEGAAFMAAWNANEQNPRIVRYQSAPGQRIHGEPCPACPSVADCTGECGLTPPANAEWNDTVHP